MLLTSKTSKKRKVNIFFPQSVYVSIISIQCMSVASVVYFLSATAVCSDRNSRLSKIVATNYNILGNLIV